MHHRRAPSGSVPPLTIDVNELAEVLGIGVNGAYKLLRDRTTPSVYVERRLRVRWDDVQAYVATLETHGPDAETPR